MERVKSNILLLGYGEMGHTMEFLLSSHHIISLWDPFSTEDLKPVDLEQAAARADFIIFCTPTVAIYELASQIAAKVTPHCICLSMAKSLDTAGRTAAEALLQGLNGACDYGLLYGPMIAEEILTGKPGFAMLATNSSTVFTPASKLFANSQLKLKSSDDVTGCAWSVILKNVYALLFGMADELGLGDNMRGFLAVETLNELSSIMSLKQGQPDTPYTLAGLGDLITTATSPDSHHHELGMQLARNQRENISGEGINTLKTLVKLNLLAFPDYPLLQIVEQVALHNADSNTLLDDYIDSN